MRGESLTCILLGGDYKIAVSGFSYGCPAEQGVIVLEFLRDKMDKSGFLEKLKNAKFISYATYMLMHVECVMSNCSYAKWPIWPETDNYNAEKVLQSIHDTAGPFFIVNTLYESDWIDKVFSPKDFREIEWEWCYCINFDKNVLEVYERVDGEAFETLTTFSLDNLPDNNEFLVYWMWKNGNDYDD